jgi:L-fucose isomerase-like protein
MQVVFHVTARPTLRESLRELIIADLQKWEYLLEVESEKKVGRRGGWAKIKAKDVPGVINITWHAGSKTLIARAIAKQGNTPSLLVGRFVGYLLECRRRDVRSVTVHPV